jgi:hypothetical protein
MNQDLFELDTKVARELDTVLNGADVGSDFEVQPSNDLLYLLELYIPNLLSRRYPIWEQESLDGFFLAYARKIGLGTAELAGICILISDQTVTPVLIRLTLNSSCDSIQSYQVFLGESGDGRLGISGPLCNSPRAQKLLDTIGTRLSTIRWSYALASDETY